MTDEGRRKRLTSLFLSEERQSVMVCAAANLLGCSGSGQRKCLKFAMTVQVVARVYSDSNESLRLLASSPEFCAKLARY